MEITFTSPQNMVKAMKIFACSLSHYRFVLLCEENTILYTLVDKREETNVMDDNIKWNF
jgi:hypothetical protein